MQHTDHGLAAGDQAPDQQQPVGLVRRVEVGQRLVHQQHIGIHRQRPGQQHALAFTARQFTQAAVPPLPGMGGAQGGFNGSMVGHAGRGQPGLMRQAAQHGHVIGGQVVGTGFVLAQPRQLPGAAFGRHCLHRLAQQHDLAGVRQQPGQHLEQG